VNGKILRSILWALPESNCGVPSKTGRDRILEKEKLANESLDLLKGQNRASGPPQEFLPALQPSQDNRYGCYLVRDICACAGEVVAKRMK
jgi:hypothetical protein